MDSYHLGDTTNFTLGLHSIEDYGPLVGDQVVQRINKRAERLHGQRIVHVNSRIYGGSVAETMTQFPLLSNKMGIKTECRASQRTDEFFVYTKKKHNVLQGAEVELSDIHKMVYEAVVQPRPL